MRSYSVVGKQIGLLLKNVQRTKKVEQNISSVNDCLEKLSNRIDKMDKECLSLAEQAKEGVRTHIKRGFSLPVPLQVQLRTTPSSPNRQEVPPMLRDSGLASSMATSSTASTSRLGDELTQRFTKLNTESFEVKEQVEKNQKSVEENDRMLKFGVQETLSPDLFAASADRGGATWEGGANG